MPESADSFEQFAAALDMSDEERRRFLAELDRAAPAASAEVRSLLDNHARAGDFMTPPAAPPLPLPAVVSPGPSAAAIGKHLGPYRLDTLIGTGGMSEVYLAERADERFRKRVAVKVLRHGMDTQEMLARFRVERQVLADLEHPNIARLIDGGEADDGSPYIVMEYVEGLPIDRYCEEQRLTIPDRLQLFAIICQAVQYAHTHLVVHRDLKPSNILVTARGVPKLLDFGIAKLLSLDGLDHTLTGDSLLTPRFASPEQVQGATITTATDIYSLGLILYLMLTGSLPYEAATASTWELIERIRTEEPARPSALAAAAPPNVPLARHTNARQLVGALRGDLDNIVLRALQKDPDRRYRSAAGLADDVDRHLTDRPVEARPDTLGYRAGKWLRRHRAAALAAVVVFVAILAATVLSTSQFLRAAMIAVLGTATLLSFGLYLRAERLRQAARSFQTAAEQHRSRAERVSSFLKDMLRSVDPAVAMGHDTTLLRRILTDASQRAATELTEQPLVAAEIHQTIGVTFTSLANYELAEQHLRRAIELLEHEADRNGWLEGQSGLALVLYRRGRYDEAIEQIDEVLASSNDDSGTGVMIDPHHRIELLKSRGLAYVGKGDIDRGESSLREALRDAERLDGHTSERVSACLADLGLALGERVEHDRLDEAEAILRESIRIDRIQGRDRTPSFARVLLSLAWVLFAARRYDESATAYREALELQSGFLPEEHADLAYGLKGLGRVLIAQGDASDFEEAERLLERALTIQRRALGDEHRAVATDWTYLGALYLKWQRYEDARRCYEQARELYAQSLGTDHAWTHMARSGLAQALLGAGAAPAAEAICREIIAAGAPIRKARHLVERAELMLGVALVDQGRLDEAGRHLPGRLEWCAAQIDFNPLVIRIAFDRTLRLLESTGREQEASRLRRAMVGATVGHDNSPRTPDCVTDDH